MPILFYFFNLFHVKDVPTHSFPFKKLFPRINFIRKNSLFYQYEIYQILKYLINCYALDMAFEKFI